MNKPAVSMPIKLAFGIGASGEAATNWIFNALTFFYYTQILGLSGTMTAAAVTIGIASDAITDPLMGSISDRWRSTLGRRHPFMFAAPLPLVVTIYLIFNPPVEYAGWALFAWFAVFTVLMRVCSTLFAVPHLAMGAELSDDYIERSKIMSYNNIFTYVGVIIMHVVVWVFIFPSYDDGRMTQVAYMPIVIFCSSLIMTCMLGSAFATRGQIAIMKKVPDDLPPFSFRQLLSEMYSAIQNRNYLFLLLGLFFLSLTIGTHETLGLYMYTFYWEFTDQQIAVLILSNVFWLCHRFCDGCNIAYDHRKKMGHRCYSSRIKRDLVSSSDVTFVRHGARKYNLVAGGIYHSVWHDGKCLWFYPQY